jgi:hypothetical protein
MVILVCAVVGVRTFKREPVRVIVLMCVCCFQGLVCILVSLVYHYCEIRISYRLLTCVQHGEGGGRGGAWSRLPRDAEYVFRHYFATLGGHRFLWSCLRYVSYTVLPGQSIDVVDLLVTLNK